MAELRITVDHSTLHRRVIRLVPLLDKAFRWHKRAVGRRWRMNERYIRVRGRDVTTIFVRYGERLFECHELHTRHHRELIGDVIARFCLNAPLNSVH